MAILWYNICSIMIGSLWDLKLSKVAVKSFSVDDYHDRFPMGFETIVQIPMPLGMLTIMIGSLWDLKPDYGTRLLCVKFYNNRLPLGFETLNQVTYFYTYATIILDSLWDLKPI